MLPRPAPLRGRWIILFAAVVSLSAFCEAEAPKRWEVRVDVQMVAVPVPAALRLIPQLRGSETFASADSQLQTLIATGEAEMLGWPMARVYNREDLRVARHQFGSVDFPVTQSIREIRFPTEFEPPQLPGGLFRPPKAPDWFDGYSVSPIMTPTAVETRNTGSTMAMAAHVDAMGQLVLALRAELVQLAAIEPAIGARSEQPGNRLIEQPRFVVFKAAQSFTMANDEHLLLSTFIDKGQAPRMIIFLLHAVAHSTPALLNP